MIVVIDTNVWISAFQFSGAPLKLVDYALDEHQVALCDSIVHEARTVLRERFAWSASRIDEAFSDYFAEVDLVRIRGMVHGICRDPNDDMILECAVAANADVIISGDKDLLALDQYEGIRILTPRAFLDEFSG